MKKFLLLIPALLIAGMFFYGCQEEPNIIEPDSSPSNKVVGGYDIVLIGGEPVDNGDETYTWTWSVSNTNPGNGSDDTYNDLSHWDFVPGDCLIEADIESAAYRYGPDGAFTPIELTSPYFKTDESNECEGENLVFKFDYGTEYLGLDVTTFYQLVINKNYAVDPEAIAYWKAATLCGEGTFDGIGCEKIVVDPCTYETAWADGDRYVTRGNWATYTPFVANSTVPLYAGKTMEAGTVDFSDCDGKVTITINLGDGWELQDVDEPVKVQGYSTAPSGNPSPGLFTSYKGDLLEFDVACWDFYGIHLDVKWCPPPPCDETVGIVYGMERYSGDVYEINLVTRTAELSFESILPPPASATPNGLAYDYENQRMYYCDYNAGGNPRPLYFWDYNTNTEHVAGTLPVENAAADFYAGKYYYFKSIPGTDDLYEVTFNPDGTILTQIKLDDISDNSHAWTFNGDIAIKDGILYGWGKCVTHNTFEFFTYNLSTEVFNKYDVTFQYSLQLAFGSNGDVLYGHRSGAPGNFYAIDVTNGLVSAPITIASGELYTDCASGYTCP